MSLRLNSNPNSTIAQRHLSNSVANHAKSQTRLASGTRLNSSADDAASFSVTNKMAATVRSFKMAERNVEDARSLIQVAEGSLTTLAAELIRLREIMIQSANGVNSPGERRMMDEEVQALKEEFNRICESTEFKGVKLLDGIGPNVQIAIGASAESSSFLEINKGDMAVGLGDLGLADISAATVESSQSALPILDEAQTKLSTTRSNLAAIAQRLESIGETQRTARTLVQSAKGRIADTDLSEEIAETVKSNILKDTGVAMLTQINKNPGKAMDLLKT